MQTMKKSRALIIRAKMHVSFDVGLSGKDVAKYKKSKVKSASTYPAVEQGQTFPV